MLAIPSYRVLRPAGEQNQTVIYRINPGSDTQQSNDATDQHSHSGNHRPALLLRKTAAISRDTSDSVELSESLFQRRILRLPTPLPTPLPARQQPFSPAAEDYEPERWDGLA